MPIWTLKEVLVRDARYWSLNLLLPVVWKDSECYMKEMKRVLDEYQSFVAPSITSWKRRCILLEYDWTRYFLCDGRQNQWLTACSVHRSQGGRIEGGHHQSLIQGGDRSGGIASHWWYTASSLGQCFSSFKKPLCTTAYQSNIFALRVCFCKAIFLRKKNYFTLKNLSGASSILFPLLTTRSLKRLAVNNAAFFVAS